MPTLDVPQRARVVIVGGGIAGCSVAYHLAELGWTDVVLVEQGQLSCGTTWHAAGIIGQLRTHSSLTRLMLDSSRLYAGLESMTGQGTGWNQSGALWVAASQDRVVQLRRTVDLATAQGVEAHIISVAEAAAAWPLMYSGDLVGAVWLPNDAKANPADITQALARGARKAGARILERTRVTGFTVTRGRVTTVRTARGDIECEYLVNCGGQWAKALGDQVGVTIPVQPAEHFYIVTEAIEGLDRTTPTLRDPDSFTYFKEEVRGLLMGGFEPNAKPWLASDEIPVPFEFQLLPEDWDQFDILMRGAIHRVPVMEKTGVKKFYNGPESFTPDHNFILGQAPELQNYFVAAGFNSYQAVHDLDVLRRGVPDGLRAEFFDMTSASAVFSVMGPRSRELLARLSGDDLSGDVFPFGWSREIDLAGLTVRATRLTFVGELGWELHVPSEAAVAAFERLTDPGGTVAAVLAGYYAIDSLRMEKGYRVWGRELTPDTTPVEAGLAFTCKMGSGIDFRGRDAVRRHQAEGVTRRLASFIIADPGAYAWGNELLLRTLSRSAWSARPLSGTPSAGPCCSATWSAATGGGQTGRGSARAATRWPSAANSTTPR